MPQPSFINKDRHTETKIQVPESGNQIRLGVIAEVLITPVQHHKKWGDLCISDVTETLCDRATDAVEGSSFFFFCCDGS